MEKKALVFLADGLEEVEAITPIDYLRRAGIRVTTAAIGPGELVQGSHKVNITADTTLGKLTAQGAAHAADWDAVVLPGGGVGSENLAASAGWAASSRLWRRRANWSVPSARLRRWYWPPWAC